MLAVSKVKMCFRSKKKKKANRKTSIKIFCEHIRHFLHKTCNYWGSFTLQQQQRQANVQKRALHMQSCFFAEYRRNILPQFIEICMETPCGCPPGWAPTWWTETNKNICYRVLVQKSRFILRGTHIHIRWLKIINEEGLLVIMWNCLIHFF